MHRRNLKAPQQFKSKILFCRELPEAEAVATTFRPAQLPKLKKVLKGKLSQKFLKGEITQNCSEMWYTANRFYNVSYRKQTRKVRYHRNALTSKRDHRKVLKGEIQTCSERWDINMFWKVRYHIKVLKGELLQKILNGEITQKVSKRWNTTKRLWMVRYHSKFLRGEIQYYKHVLNGEIPQNVP